MYKPTQSLKYLGKRFDRINYHKQADTWQLELAQDIIKKAIYKHCPIEMALHIINDFRRSDGSSEAAEINFLKTDQPNFTLHKDEHYFRALRVTQKLFQPDHKLRPVAFPDLRYYPWNLRTSAEAPYSMKDKWFEQTKFKFQAGINKSEARTFHNLYDEIFTKNRSLIHLIKAKDRKFFTNDGTPIPYYWHSLHTRAHLVKKEEDDKNRAVFGTPKLLLMAENMFLWPLMKEYLNKEFSSPLLWGYETFKGGWKRLYKDIFNNKKPNSFLGLDWSGFDRKALHSIIDDVHDVWESYFDFDKGYHPTNQYPEPISNTSEAKIRNLWNWVKHSVKKTPIRAESGNLYEFGDNGIASGFQETQLLDSFVNSIMILTCLSSLGIDIESPDFFFKVQGDDSVVAFPERMFDMYGKSFLDLIAKEAEMRFNATLNVNKSSFSNRLSDIDVLSYGNRNGTAYRDNAQLLAQFLYPERYRTLGAFASASVGIAQASMGQSKIVYNVCKDVWDYLTEVFIDSRTNDHIKPRPIRFLYLGIGNSIADQAELLPTRFPTLLEIKDQQFFENKERTYSQKQRLWPTDAIGVSDEHPGGFKFLGI